MPLQVGGLKGIKLMQNTPNLASVMRMKADEHARIQQEIRDAQARAEKRLQERMAQDWIKNNAAGLIPKIEAIAIRGGRLYVFRLTPDARYSDCSGGWQITFNALREWLFQEGFSLTEVGGRANLHPQCVEVHW